MDPQVHGTAVYAIHSMSSYEILIDSDAWVGFYMVKDPHYGAAKKHFNKIIKRKQKIVLTSYICDEVVTILSNRQSAKAAVEFLNIIEETKIPVIFITQDLREGGLNILKKQTKRGMSVTDCINVHLMNKLSIPNIFAFDKIYHKQFKLKNIVYK